MSYFDSRVVAIVLLAAGQDPAGAAGTRSWSRVGSDELIAMLPAIGEGEWRSDPVRRRALAPAVAELKARLDGGDALTDEQWREALVRSGAIRARARWPVDEPFAISMRMPAWLPVAEIRLTPRDPGLAGARAGSVIQQTCSFGASATYSAGLHQRVGNVVSGPNLLRFDATVERGRTSLPSPEERAADPGVLWRGSWTVEATGVGSLDEVMPATRGNDVDAAIRDAVGVTFLTHKNDGVSRRTAVVIVALDPERHPVLESTAVSIRLEVLDESRVAETLTFVANDDETRRRRRSSGTGLTWNTTRRLSSIPPGVEHDQDLEARWRLRLSSSDENVLRVWHADRRWQGQVDVPLHAAVSRERARAGR